MSRLRLLSAAALLAVAANSHATSFIVTKSCAPPVTTPPASWPAKAPFEA